MRHQRETRDAQRPRQRCALERTNVQSRVTPRCVFLLEAGDAFRRRTEPNRGAGLQAALDSKAAKGRDVFERATASDLIDVPGVAHAMLLRKLVEIGLGLMDDDAGRSRRLPLRNTALLEQRDIHAGSREHICHGAADRTTTDDGDFSSKGAAVTGIRRPPGGGKSI